MEIGAGLTILKTTNLNFKTSRTFGRSEENGQLCSIMGLIRTAMKIRCFPVQERINFGKEGGDRQDI
jgi:hypothetical protein